MIDNRGETKNDHLTIDEAWQLAAGTDRGVLTKHKNPLLWWKNAVEVCHRCKAFSID